MTKFLVIVLFIITVIWLIKSNNNFIQLKNYIDKCRSAVVGAINSQDTRYTNAIKAAGRFADNETRSNGHQGQNVLGHMRELNSSTGWNTNISQDVSDFAFIDLRNAIINYNNAISVFPASFAAYILGYQKEELPDSEQMIQKSSHTKQAENVNDNKYLQ